jgi:hypothetical protein
MYYPLVMPRYFVAIIVILFAGFGVRTAKPGEPVLLPVPKESEAPRKSISKSAVRDRSKSIVSERAPMPVGKLSSYLFWTVRLPWSPNAPGD